MSSTLDALITALTAEFTDEVIFMPTIPSTISAPSVVVAPGEPWLEPSTTGTAGMIQERWDILTAVSVAEPGPGVDLMRNLSLRVRKAVSGAGAVWRNASGARRLAAMGDQTQIVFSLNTVTFNYNADNHLTP